MSTIARSLQQSQSLGRGLQTRDRMHAAISRHAHWTETLYVGAVSHPHVSTQTAVQEQVPDLASV